MPQSASYGALPCPTATLSDFLFLPDGADPHDDVAAREAALAALEATDQLLRVAAAARCGAVVTDGAVQRCLVALSKALATTENYHHTYRCPNCSKALGLAASVWRLYAETVAELASRPEAPREGWRALPEAARPLRPGVELQCEGYRADGHGLIASASVTWGATAGLWHPLAWSGLVERLRGFDAAALAALIEAIDAEAAPPAAKAETEPSEPAGPMAALLRVYTGGIADERLRQAAQVLGDVALTVGEKLARLDSLLRIPPTVSAEQLAQLLGVSKQAVMKTGWWQRNRRGLRDEAIEQRRCRLRERGRRYDRPDDNGETR